MSTQSLEHELIAGVSTIPSKQKQPVSADEWYMHTMEYYPAMKRGTALINAVPRRKRYALKHCKALCSVKEARHKRTRMIPSM